MWRAGSITGDILFYSKSFGEWRPLVSIIELLEPSTSKPSPTTTARVPIKRRRRWSESAGAVFLLCLFGFGSYLFLRGKLNESKTPGPPVPFDRSSVLNDRPSSPPLASPASDRGEAAEDGLNKGHYLGRETGRDGRPIPNRETLHSIALRMAGNSPFHDQEAWVLGFENGFATGYREATEKAFK